MNDTESFRRYADALSTLARAAYLGTSDAVAAIEEGSLRLVEANPAFRELLGLATGTLPASIAEVFPEMGTMSRLTETVGSQPLPVAFAARITRPAGGERAVLVRAIRVRTAAGAWIVLFIRPEAVEAVEVVPPEPEPEPEVAASAPAVAVPHDELLLRVETSEGAAIAADAAGFVVALSQSFGSLSGFDPSALREGRLSCLDHPMQNPEFARSWAAEGGGKPEWKGNAVLRRANGSLLPVKARIERLEDGWRGLFLVDRSEEIAGIADAGRRLDAGAAVEGSLGSVLAGDEGPSTLVRPPAVRREVPAAVPPAPPAPPLPPPATSRGSQGATFNIGEILRELSEEFDQPRTRKRGEPPPQ